MEQNINDFIQETTEADVINQYDFTNPKDDQGLVSEEQDDMVLDTDDFDIFSNLDDIVIDEETSPTWNDNKDANDQEELDHDPDELDEFEDEQSAHLMDSVSKVSDNWDNIPEDTVLFSGMTKADIQTAIQSKQDNSIYNEEFNNFKAHIEEGYKNINEALYESLSETDITLEELMVKKANSMTNEQRGAIDAAIESYQRRKNMLRQKASTITKEIEKAKEMTRKQDMVNFVQSARREYGSNWEQEINNIGQGLSPQVETILRNNPSVELLNLIRDAKSHRSKVESNKQAVRNAGKKNKTSAKSVSSNNKGTKVSSNSRAKAEKAFEEGKLSASDVFNFLED
ncbi:TPA: hypothetical protein NJ597_001228 [Vibrio parahaemolyticus]|nr:hypothetical protein [Vibrio parahaemolyticus]